MTRCYLLQRTQNKQTRDHYAKKKIQFREKIRYLKPEIGGQHVGHMEKWWNNIYSHGLTKVMGQNKETILFSNQGGAKE